MQHYRLIFDGHLQPQASREEVQRQLADLFQVSPEQVEALFSKPPVVLKEDLEYDTALKDKASFEATGALCRLEAQPTAFRTTLWGAERRTARQTADEKTAHPLGERQFGLRHPYTLAFFSPAFYADVAAHWRRLAFAHLLLVLLLSTAVYMQQFHTLISAFMAEEAPPIIAQIPQIRIQNGHVQVDGDEPYYIYQTNSEKVFAVIDTTGKILSLKQTDAVLLLTGTRLAARLSAGDSRVLDLSPIESLQINQAVVSQWLRDAQRWLPFILFPLTLGFSFIFRSVQALLYGGIGMGLASMHRFPLPFGAAVSIAIMAMTPVLLIDALLVLLDIYLPLWGIGGFLLAMGYLFFGIRSVARASR
jgi:Protein of unknown function (DUF1189)